MREGCVCVFVRVCANAGMGGTDVCVCSLTEGVIYVSDLSSGTYKIFSRLEWTSLEGAEAQMDMLGGKAQE